MAVFIQCIMFKKKKKRYDGQHKKWLDEKKHRHFLRKDKHQMNTFR